MLPTLVGTAVIRVAQASIRQIGAQERGEVPRTTVTFLYIMCSLSSHFELHLPDMRGFRRGSKVAVALGEADSEWHGIDTIDSRGKGYAV